MSALPSTTLGRTGLEVTRIGFGAWAIGGGGYRFGWGPQDDAASLAALEHALEHGVTWIDTAPVYGLGRSEEVVGRALRAATARPLVFTKVSPHPDDDGNIVYELERDAIRRQADLSTRRLGVDAIDLLQIHAPIPEGDLERGWEALLELREEGLVRHVGVCNVNREQLDRLEAIAPVETLQVGCSLIDRRNESELAEATARGIGTLAYSPLGSGLLSGAMTRERIASLPRDDWRRRNQNFREPLLTRNLELVAGLARLAERLGTTSGGLALAWVLRHAAVSAAIVGWRSPGQVDALLDAASLDLDALADELEELGIELPAEATPAPVPSLRS